jgi:hypothetical protein
MRSLEKERQICEEYLKQGETIVTVGQKFSMPFQTISKIIWRSGNEKAISKIKLLRNKKNPSIMIDIDEERIGIVANNTKSVFIFPRYVKEAIEGLSWNENGGYITARVKGIKQKIQGHYFVIGSPINGMFADHIDGNPKNNMPDNLRIVTRSINAHNANIKNKSGYRGVFFSKSSNKWYAQIRIDNEEFHLGSFTGLEDAAFRRLDVKFNLFGYEYMTAKEIEQYNQLLTSHYLKNT